MARICVSSEEARNCGSVNGRGSSIGRRRFTSTTANAPSSIAANTSSAIVVDQSCQPSTSAAVRSAKPAPRVPVTMFPASPLKSIEARADY
jgi:hypothetical protein